MNLLDTPPNWTSQTWAERIDMCASALFVHGYIPLSMREKIAAKLEKAAAQGMAARSGETGTGSTEGNSPVGATDAPNPNQGGHNEETH